MNISFDPSGRSPRSLLERIVGILLGVLALGATLFFSAVVFVILAIAGLVIWGYFWWRTRALRQQMQEQMQQMRAREFDPACRDAAQEPHDNNVIDGESVRLDDDHTRPG